MKFKWVVIALLVASSQLSSAPVETKALMHYFYGALLELKPYMVHREEFENPQNESIIRSQLTSLRAKIKNSEPQEISKAPGFNYSYNLMGRHLDDILHLMDSRIKTQAWEKLNATTSFCIGCHTRLPEKVNFEIAQWSKVAGEKKVAKTLDDAEFLFLSHQYPLALEIFDEKIRSYDPLRDGALNLMTVYERKLAFYARVQRDPGAAVKSLEQDLKNKKLPKETKEALKIWIEGFKALPVVNSSEAAFQFAKTTIEQTAQNGKIRLADPLAVKLLYSAGIIYEKMFRNPSKEEEPNLLYLLSQAERQLTSIRVFSLSDIYLLECVSEFPKAPVARQCLSDYEISMRIRYGGKLPDYINRSIESLRRNLPSTKSQI